MPVLDNYPYLTGTHSVIVNSLTVLIAVAGADRALWLRSRQPQTYHALDNEPTASGAPDTTVGVPQLSE
ncbi:hypothetical protein ACFYW9_15250 [Streptomyces sp. NPDC002698]|uniref:hypothetical protein n=1 Tax=Streptomyces sp. NPDC002698 TaxID=3364660 RepID=UPI0036805379